MSAWAFLIGINDYQYLTRLRYAVADIEALGQALIKGLAFAPERVIRMSCDMKGENRPDAVGIEDRLFWLARRLQPDDRLVFAFSGHAFQLLDGRAFLGAVDTRIGEEEKVLIRSSVSLDIVQQRLRQAAAEQIFMILDCCRDNPLPGKGGQNAQLAEALVDRVEAFTRDVAVRPARRRGKDRAFAALFACGPGEKACEWDDRRHGIFWAYLLEALDGAGAEPDGRLTAHSVASYVCKRVPSKADELFHRQQTPRFCQLEGAPIVELGRVHRPRDERASGIAQLVDGLRSRSLNALTGVLAGLRERRERLAEETDADEHGGTP